MKKNAIVYNPFKGIFEVEKDLDKVFKDFWNNDSIYYPEVDVIENDSNLVIKASVPGYSKDDIEIEIHDGYLTLKGGKKEEKEEKDKDFLRKEIREGKFERTFKLMDNLDPEKTHAEYNNGILEITIEKKEIEKPKKIMIKAS